MSSRRLSGTEPTFWDHLEALRWAIIRYLAVLLVLSVAGWFLSERALLFLEAPVGKLYFFNPAEAFWVRVKLAFWAGLFLSVPYGLAEAWLFLAPALTRREKILLGPFVLLGTALFYSGAALALFLIIPLGVKVLAGFGGSAMEPFFNASGYLDFAFWMTVGFGAAFETPLLVAALVGLGLVKPQWLKRQRPFVVVLAFLVAAIITPTVDVLTQTALALPLIILFELGLLLGTLLRRFL